MVDEHESRSNTYVARIYGGALGESLFTHSEMSSQYAKFLARIDNRTLCWALKTLSQKIPISEMEKKVEILISEIAFIHDSGKHWKEWQDSLVRGNVRYLAHDVLSGLSLLDVSGFFPEYAKKFLVSSEMDALRKEINIFTEKASKLIEVCKRDKSLAVSIALAIMSHHCCNIAELPSYLEGIREKGQMSQLIKKIIEEWKRIFEVKEAEGIAALSMLIATIVESDWYAARRSEKLKENERELFKKG
jgi:hypothetical protein